MDSELYLCATPIGNLDDMTFRAIEILKRVDFIAAEDTRRTRKLLTHFDIHTPLIHYDENNKATVGRKIIERLLGGESAACVTDAGTPGISDPGSDLVRLAIENDIKIVPIPGACAAINALIASGLDTAEFTFVGFLPQKNCRERLNELRSRRETLIFYEAPHRLQKTLDMMFEVLGARRIVLARELTKVHEEFIRGRLGEISIENPRGEFVIVIEGNLESSAVKEILDTDAPTVYNELLDKGIERKEAMRRTAKMFGLSRRDIYQMLLKENER